MPTRTASSPVTRFFAKTQPGPWETRLFWTGEGYEDVETQCLLWTGAQHNAQGYGRFSPEAGVWMVASRYAYLLAHGTIPDGTEVEHLCVNPACVEWTHLEAVTQAENARRRGIYHRLTVTECGKGHAFTAENTGWQQSANGNTTRYCKQCNRDSVAAWNAKHYVPRPRPPLGPTCVNGHDRAEHTYTSPSGKSYCRKCHRDIKRRSRSVS